MRPFTPSKLFKDSLKSLVREHLMQLEDPDLEPEWRVKFEAWIKYNTPEGRDPLDWSTEP